MKKAVIFIVISVFFISCTQEQYVYENVGTTQAVLVQHEPAKKVKVIKRKRVEKNVEKEVQQHAPSTPKTDTVTPHEDMGTQDSDWVDIGTLSLIPQKNSLIAKDTPRCNLNKTVANSESKCSKNYHLTPALQEKYDSCPDYNHVERRAQTHRTHQTLRRLMRLRKSF